MDISQTRHSCKACAQYYDDVQFQFKLAYTQKIRRESFSMYHIFFGEQQGSVCITLVIGYNIKIWLPQKQCYT